MPGNLPATWVNFNLYAGASNTGLLGVVNCTLTNMARKVDTFRSAGYGGDTELPQIGLYQAMRMGVKFTKMNTDSLPLMAPTGLQLSLRAAAQSIATASNGLVIDAQRISLMAYPLNFNLGTAEPGQQMGSTFDCSVRYIAIYDSGNNLVTIDQAGIVDSWNGTDYGAAVRAAI
jgi:phage tail tube protein FII